MSWRTLAALAALLGCSVPNQDHCAVNDGDASCKQRGDDRRYCSKCVGENNGCVLEPVSDPVCAAGTGGGSTTSPTGSTTGAPTTSTSGTTGTTLPSETTGTGTGTGTGTTTGTTGGSTSTTTDPGTTGPDTTTTTEPGTTGTSTTEADTSTSSSTTTTTTTETDTIGNKCGNGVVEGQETCDGENFDGETCKSLNDMYGGGTLMCTEACQISYAGCCYKAGIVCTKNSECCPGLMCKLGIPQSKCG